MTPCLLLHFEEDSPDMGTKDAMPSFFSRSHGQVASSVSVFTHTSTNPVKVELMPTETSALYTG